MLRSDLYNCDQNIDPVGMGMSFRHMQSPKIKVADFVVEATSEWMALFSDIWTDKWHVNSKNDALQALRQSGHVLNEPKTVYHGNSTS